jgi:cellulose biosynthesis protein BcsQ
MVDKRKKMHREIMAHLSETYPNTLNTVIPYASEIERMGIEQCPVGAYSRKTELINTYNALWQEILTLIATR